MITAAAVRSACGAEVVQYAGRRYDILGLGKND